MGCLIMHTRISLTITLIALSFFVSSCTAPKYCGTKEDREIAYTIEDFGKSRARAFGMHFLLVGKATFGENTRNCVAFTDSRNISLPDGRNLAVALAQQFVALNKTDALIQQDFSKAYSGYSKRKETLDQYIINHLGFRIAYWDAEMNRPKAPHLAEIQFYDGEIHYYEADPQTQALQLVFKETYDDGIKK